MPRRTVRLALFIVALVTPAAAPASRAGELTGVLFGSGVASGVGDPAQKYVLPDFEVQLCSQTSGECYSAVTGSDGWFRVAEIPPGTYEVVTASKGGSGSAGTVEIPPGVPTLHIEVLTP